jgi:hypothetical protein
MHRLPLPPIDSALASLTVASRLALRSGYLVHAG